MLVKGFESIVRRIDNPDGMRASLLKAIITMTLALQGSGDQAFLELMKYYDEQGILEDNEDLLMKLREHLEIRFDFLQRDTLFSSSVIS